MLFNLHSLPVPFPASPRKIRRAEDAGRLAAASHALLAVAEADRAALKDRVAALQAALTEARDADAQHRAEAAAEGGRLEAELRDLRAELDAAQVGDTFQFPFILLVHLIISCNPTDCVDPKRHTGFCA